MHFPSAALFQGSLQKPNGIRQPWTVFTSSRSIPNRNKPLRRAQPDQQKTLRTAASWSPPAWQGFHRQKLPALGSAEGPDIGISYLATQPHCMTDLRSDGDEEIKKAEHDPRRKARRLVPPWTFVGCQVVGRFRHDLP